LKKDIKSKKNGKRTASDWCGRPQNLFLGEGWVIESAATLGEKIDAFGKGTDKGGTSDCS